MIQQNQEVFRPNSCRAVVALENQWQAKYSTDRRCLELGQAGHPRELASESQTRYKKCAAITPVECRKTL